MGALYRFGSNLALRIFFQSTTILLIFIGAGVFANGMSDLYQSGIMGPLQVPIHKSLFDISDCCGLDNEFWLMMRVLFGYNPYPSGYTFITYFSYHIAVWGITIFQFENRKREALGKQKISLPCKRSSMVSSQVSSKESNLNP